MRDLDWVIKAEGQMRLTPHLMHEPDSPTPTLLAVAIERPRQPLTAPIAELVSREIRELFERILARAS